MGRRPVPTPIPTRLGEYCILRESRARGGMGVVYEAARNRSAGVALKVLPPQVKADATFLEQFRREAQAGGAAHHSNIVPVFAVGEHRRHRFYAMQYICGHTLESVLSELRLSRRRITCGPSAGRHRGVLERARACSPRSSSWAR